MSSKRSAFSNMKNKYSSEPEERPYGGLPDDLLGELAAAKNATSSPQLDELRQELEAVRSNAIVRTSDNHWQFNRFELTPTKLISPDDLSVDEVYELGFALSGMSGAINFWLGDWANLFLYAEEAKKGAELSEEERHQVYARLVDEFNLDSLNSLRQYASVCRIIPPSNRLDGVHYTNHQLVAFLPKELKGREQEFLGMASSEGLSKRELEKRIKDARAKLLPEPPAPVFDPKPIMKKMKRLTGLMSLSDDARLTQRDRDRYLDDLEEMKRWIRQLEEKLR